MQPALVLTSLLALGGIALGVIANSKDHNRSSRHCPVGPTGPAEATGLQGNNGQRGPTGINGAAGTTGASGATGLGLA